MTFGFGDDIHAEMHAINEIDVGVAGWAEHSFGARREAASGMGGEVVGAEIGFGLDDFADAAGAVGDVDEVFAEQFARDEGGVPVVEGARQFLHRRRLFGWYTRKQCYEELFGSEQS